MQSLNEVVGEVKRIDYASSAEYHAKLDAVVSEWHQSRFKQIMSDFSTAARRADFNNGRPQLAFRSVARLRLDQGAGLFFKGDLRAIKERIHMLRTICCFIEPAVTYEIPGKDLCEKEFNPEIARLQHKIGRVQLICPATGFLVGIALAVLLVSRLEVWSPSQAATVMTGGLLAGVGGGLGCVFARRVAIDKAELEMSRDTRLAHALFAEMVALRIYRKLTFQHSSKDLQKWEDDPVLAEHLCLITQLPIVHAAKVSCCGKLFEERDIAYWLFTQKRDQPGSESCPHCRANLTAKAIEFVNDVSEKQFRRLHYLVQQALFARLPQPE